MSQKRHSFSILAIIVSMVFSLLVPTRASADDVPPSEPVSQEEALPPEPASEGQGVDVVIIDEAGQTVQMSTPEGENALLNGQPVWCPDGSGLGEAGCSGSYGSIGDLLVDVSSSNSSQDGTIYIQTTSAEAAGVAEMPSADQASDLLQESENAVVGIQVGDEMVDVVDVDPNAQVTAVVTCTEGEASGVENADCSGSVVGAVAEAHIVDSDPSYAVNVDPAAEVPAEAPVAVEVAPETEEVLSEPAPSLDAPVEVALNDEVAPVEPAVIRDPVWCPGANAPTPGALGCTNSFATLGDLVTHLLLNEPAQDGTIWIEQGADLTGATVDLDGSATSGWEAYSLALQGGWDGISGSANTPGISSFANPIYIYGWGGNVSISRILIHDTTELGLGVNTQGDIVLDNVSATGNDFGGVVLDNCDWGYDDSDPDPANWYWRCFGAGTGSVYVDGTNSSFSDNGSIAFGGNGLGIYSNGDVVLNNITADRNQLGGGYVGGTGLEVVSTSGDVVVTGTNQFYANSVSGASFQVQNGGNLYLENLNVNNTDWNGVSASLDTGDAVVAGNNSFINTGGDALIILSNGEIYAENIYANMTGGLHLETHNGSVYLAGSNYFYNTIYQGHVVFIQASNDIFIENTVSVGGDNGDGMKLGANGDVTINCSYSANNSEYGLEVGFNDWLTGNPLDPTSVNLNSVAFSNNGFGDYVVYGLNTVLNTDSGYPCPVPASGGNGNGDNDGRGSNSSQPISSQSFLPSFPLPFNIISFGNEGLSSPILLDCSTNSGVVLSFVNGFSATYICPASGSASMTIIGDSNGLPGALPEGSTFVVGLNALLTNGVVPFVDGRLQMSFPVPADLLGANLSVLFWNGTAWVELSTVVFTDGSLVYNSGFITPDGKFQFETNFPGIFVLVKK